LWGTIYGYVLWHDVPSHTVLMGAPVLMVAIIYIVRYSPRRAATSGGGTPAAVGSGVLPKPEICFRPDP